MSARKQLYGPGVLLVHVGGTARDPGLLSHHGRCGRIYNLVVVTAKMGVDREVSVSVDSERVREVSVDRKVSVDRELFGSPSASQQQVTPGVALPWCHPPLAA